MSEPIRLSAKARLAAKPADLWPFLSDTDRLNRAVGLPSIRFEAEPGQPGRYKARTRFLGLSVEYVELPFEWVEPRYHRVVRRFTSGPFEEVTASTRLTEAGGGTDVEIAVDIRPAGALGTLLARTVLRRMAAQGLLDLARAYDEHLRSPGLAPMPALPPSGSVRSEALSARLAELRRLGVEGALAGRLEKLLSEGSDIDVARVRPFEQAEAWGVARGAALDAFLKASKAGLFDLVWSARCPHCRGTTRAADRLSDMPAGAFCDTCQVDFTCDLAETIELVFRANAGVRSAVPADYCIGGPANFRRIVAQLRLAPGEKRTERVRLESPAVRARCFQAGTPEAFRLGEGRGGRLGLRCLPEKLAVELDGAGPGELELTAENALAEEALLTLERDTFHDNAATAAQVVTMQEFRELFPAETVARGRELAIARLAVLFTDLEGSTAMYVKLGDAKAFSFVQGHFRFLVEAAARHEGGLVKTIGDSVMAAFPAGRQAVEAALEMQKGWSKFLESQGMPRGPRLKIGLHLGPSIAIDNEGRLDYFGTTVNVAARVQSAAEAGEIAFTEAVRADAGVQAALHAAGVEPAQRRCELKGLPGPHVLFGVK